jgi:hypothetical protein
MTDSKKREDELISSRSFQRAAMSSAAANDRLREIAQIPPHERGQALIELGQRMGVAKFWQSVEPPEEGGEIPLASSESAD